MLINRKIIMKKTITLDEFIIKSQKQYSHSTGSLTRLLRDIGIAAKIINREVNRAGLVNILGEAGVDNASGDIVQKLDILANQAFIECLGNSGECCGIASEELADFVEVKPIENKTADYVVVMDPLDGSSNIDVNVSVGTIFGIYRRKTEVNSKTEQIDFLQKGSDLVAAGYVLYGTSTMLVYTTGEGVNGFTLDPGIGEFCLSHEQIKMPKRGNYYSVNQGYYIKFNEKMRRYLDFCTDQNLRLRYIGSMVADVHRNLFKGGIFLYPATSKNPYGKLRLLYECNPMSFIIEQAGGQAVTTDGERILDLEVTSLHQTCPVVMGSYDMLEEMKNFVANFEPVHGQ